MSILTALAIGVGVAGIATQMTGQKQAAEFQQKQIQAQKRAEAEREKAMELDAMRRKREMIRNSVAARSAALAVATNQGAQLGSALPGAYGGISGRTGVNTLGVNQNLEIGRNIFDAKANEFAASSGYASAQSTASTGAGLVSLGNAFLKNYGEINRVGTYVSSFFNPGSNFNSGTPATFAKLNFGSPVY